ncbi:hypothetical protein BSL82_11675 [Tardibacter chloracetimidivorans]|uniref:Amidohydrolase 3 domain-containing protein n=1 Tax=Tardibacter chloracetimidivorans TaxID=1921510 RepID=A0A1L3ZWA8_9SPHN|nr:amidohydrolase family protein [Tardibacter chloracetimidivorans]API59889.1 hypothetical protein BSL82_11675 [Tardibacter chloracetimidivorans]
MYDIKIVGGTVIDGTGAEARSASVAIKDGRIVEVGACDGGAREIIDAAGRVVSPGFIDVHTHYDAQSFWDATYSPSCYHGVTTILGGFCGFSIAPLSPSAGEYLCSMLARVEGMPLQTLQSAVPWDWQSFGDFLGRLDGKVGLNAGFYCGHSAIRRVVMGERAVGEEATPEEIGEMKALLASSLEQGALGFSTTISPSHNDGDGNPVPSRWASRTELLELASVVRDYEGTGLELLPDLAIPDGTRELMTDFSLAGQRPVNWNVLTVTGTTQIDEQRLEKHLGLSDFARSKGAEVVALAAPCTPNVYINLHGGVLFDMNPGLWQTIFRVPFDERVEMFKDPEVRRQLAEEAASVPADAPMITIARLARMRIASVINPENEKYVDQFVGDIATEQGREVIDVMLDIALADGLKTTFAPEIGGEDPETYKVRGKVWLDDRTLIGASDAGAHMDMIDTFAFSTIILQRAVREYGVLSLVEAVHQMTKVPADFMGLKDRGVLAPGLCADVVVFDPETVGCGPVYMRGDVPGDAERLYADAVGVGEVIVNGVTIVRGGEHTGARPGKVLRRESDTFTNLIAAARPA